jgi:hypothetical protein
MVRGGSNVERRCIEVPKKNAEVETLEETTATGSKSDLFRVMYAAGKTVAEIARETNSNYSFVYGVLAKEAQKNGEKLSTNSSKGERSAMIRKMWDENPDITVGQIAKQLNANYSFVHSVIKKHRESQAN